MKRTTTAFFLLVLIFLLLGSPACGPKAVSVEDPDFDETAEYISSSESPNFDYSCKIEVNGLPPEGGSISLVYNVNILVKEPAKIYKNVLATCMLDKSVQDLLIVPVRKYFGTAASEHLVLSKDNRGLVLGLSTWIDQGIPAAELKRCLERPLKVKVKWDHFEEYVLIDGETIELTVHDY